VYPQEEQKELGILSETDMTEIVNDLYGIGISNKRAGVTDETLRWFDEALDEIPLHQKMSLVKAQRINPNLVDKKQKAVFLRWADFNVRKAAARYVKYWNNRQELFGDDAFFPLTLDRALTKENAIMLSHPHRILTQKDNYGRAIIWGDPVPYNRAIHSKESVLRCFWYNIHNALEDEAVQQKGFILIVDVRNGDISKHFDRAAEKLKFHSINECLPMKLKSVHIIRPSTFGYLIMPIIKFIIGRILRLRFVVHTGTEKEILESFSSYGISEDIILSQTRR